MEHHVSNILHDYYYILCSLPLQARRAAEREEARRRQIAAKEGFMALLEDAAELEPGDSFDRAARLLNHDGRWKVSGLSSCLQPKVSTQQGHRYSTHNLP
jgi:hypothetical protein